MMDLDDILAELEGERETRRDQSSMGESKWRSSTSLAQENRPTRGATIQQQDPSQSPSAGLSIRSKRLEELILGYPSTASSSGTSSLSGTLTPTTAEQLRNKELSRSSMQMKSTLDELLMMIDDKAASYETELSRDDFGRDRGDSSPQRVFQTSPRAGPSRLSYEEPPPAPSNAPSLQTTLRSSTELQSPVKYGSGRAPIKSSVSNNSINIFDDSIDDTILMMEEELQKTSKDRLKGSFIQDMPQMRASTRKKLGDDLPDELADLLFLSEVNDPNAGRSSERGYTISAPPSVAEHSFDNFEPASPPQQAQPKKGKPYQATADAGILSSLGSVFAAKEEAENQRLAELEALILPEPAPGRAYDEIQLPSQNQGYNTRSRDSLTSILDEPELSPYKPPQNYNYSDYAQQLSLFDDDAPPLPSSVYSTLRAPPRSSPAPTISSSTYTPTPRPQIDFGEPAPVNRVVPSTFDPDRKHDVIHNKIYGTITEAPQQIRQQPWSIRLSDLTFDTVLNSDGGVYGQTIKGEYAYKQQGRKLVVAIKKFSYQNLTDTFLSKFDREMNRLTSLQHPNLTAVVGLCTEQYIHIINEWIYGAESLHSYIHFTNTERINERNLTPTFIHKITQQLADGIHYLHKNGVIHFSLSTKNILLDERMNVKICDHGFVFVKVEVRSFGQIFGIEYIAPEVLENKEFTEKIDQYSFAIVVNELWSQEIPFEGLPPKAVIASVIKNDARPKISSNTPTSFSKVIEACWHKDPTLRPTFQRLQAIFSQPSEKLLQYADKPKMVMSDPPLPSSPHN